MLEDEEYQIRSEALAAAARIYEGAAGERYISAGAVTSMANEFEKYLRYDSHA